MSDEKRGGPGLAPGQKPMNFGPSAKRLLGRLRPERLRISLVIVLTVISVGLNVLGPKILGNATTLVFEGAISLQIPEGVSKAQLIEGLRQNGQNQQADMMSSMTLTPGEGIDVGALGGTLLLALAVYLFSFGFALVQALILNGVVQRTVYRMRQDVEHKIHALPLRYFDSVPRGELLSRVTNDIDNISQSLQQTMSQILTSLLTVIGVVTMMLIISPLLAVVALVMVPISVVVTAQIAKRSQKRFVAQWRSTGELNAQIEEGYTGHALVKVFGRQREVSQRFRTKNDELYKASFGAQFISGIIMPAMTFIGNLLYVVIAVIGGLMVSGGSLALGDIQAFIQYSRQFTQPLAQLGSMANLLQSGVASAERVFELLDADEQSPDPERPGIPEAERGRLEFDDVSFNYSPDAPLIEHLSLVAEPGSTIAIVGPTGAGKTTLVNLIMRFYEPTHGRIMLDGVDVATMTRDGLRSRTGMVLQDTWLFEGTIKENIAYGRPGATDDEIMDAARAAYVDRFVHALPDGYDTVLGDDADNVSAGEKQLLTIARAFIAKPDILILDEATSSVDTRTEVLVQEAMAALRADRTSFVIAHRLSTIRDADVIVVMQNGQIVESGNHDQLLQADGAYAALYRSQFEAPLDEDLGGDSLAVDLAGNLPPQT
ncbi:ABC transporter ATP-binding protein [Microbacterium sp. MPKO10]|uniref:ABC transporter ATP-binding protein n=1 Tax=Microbacterium sp. MPKO10 TaxID=2989818 RepID=UPI002235EAED|nr:ABC transporter ATP-binding protein [Microbacterium sp. MPKO10]MCW4458360.1 ABC transporter ATP-binding protein/permease [Microbacterium sp. MPKO10]